MDPIAARLMSRIGMSAAGRTPAHSTPMVKAGIGLNPSNPLLPPVHNLRMVYLQEPLTDAEEDLHAARVALKTLEANDTEDNKIGLYRAMAKLQGKESQYFATRYIGRDKPHILNGWKTHFSDEVSYLLNLIQQEVEDADTAESSAESALERVQSSSAPDDEELFEAEANHLVASRFLAFIKRAERAAITLQILDNSFMNPNRDDSAEWFSSGKNSIQTRVRTMKDEVTGRGFFVDDDGAKEVMDLAELVERLSHLVDNTRQVPHDMP